MRISTVRPPRPDRHMPVKLIQMSRCFVNIR
jgi:hypothetical protein